MISNRFLLKRTLPSSTLTTPMGTGVAAVPRMSMSVERTARATLFRTMRSGPLFMFRSSRMFRRKGSAARTLLCLGRLGRRTTPNTSKSSPYLASRIRSLPLSRDLSRVPLKRSSPRSLPTRESERRTGTDSRMRSTSSKARGAKVMAPLARTSPSATWAVRESRVTRFESARRSARTESTG